MIPVSTLLYALMKCNLKGENVLKKKVSYSVYVM